MIKEHFEAGDTIHFDFAICISKSVEFDKDDFETHLILQIKDYLEALADGKFD